MTRKSDRQPTLDETKLYAFASEEAKTRAYQITQPTKRSDAGRPSRSDSGLDIARVDKSNGVETIELKEPREFSDIGAQYSAPDFEVTAASTAKWDGKNYLISISITRSDAKYIQKIEAPIAYAIYKGFLSRRPDIIAAVFPAIDGLMTNNSFNAQFSEELNGPGELYIVPQPVTFQTPRGRICFLADVYSPVVPPPSWSSCSLFNK